MRFLDDKNFVSALHSVLSSFDPMKGSWGHVGVLPPFSLPLRVGLCHHLSLQNSQLDHGVPKWQGHQGTQFGGRESSAGGRSPAPFSVRGLELWTGRPDGLSDGKDWTVGMHALSIGLLGMSNLYLCQLGICPSWFHPQHLFYALFSPTAPEGPSVK